MANKEEPVGLTTESYSEEEEEIYRLHTKNENRTSVRKGICRGAGPKNITQYKENS